MPHQPITVMAECQQPATPPGTRPATPPAETPISPPALATAAPAPSPVRPNPRFALPPHCSVSLFDSRAEADAATTDLRSIVQASLTELVPNPPDVRMGTVMSTTRGEGASPHIAIRTYDGCKDAQELDRRVGAHLLPTLHAMPGFRSYSTADLGEGRVASISLFDSAANAASAHALAGPPVAAHLAGMVPTPPEELVGRVMSEIRACRPTDNGVG